ncbi:MAG: outer membrane beta-barrel protein [Nitrospira sp.]|nr:outer membrane beta-barrel protein [Nitrospira sp.]
MQPAAVDAETKIVPLATLTGRYDSNIWNRPAALLGPGLQLYDFLTIVGGGAQVLHESRDFDASLTAIGTFNAYVENTTRNFFATNISGSINLDRWVDQYVRGASLRVIESLRYSPDPPAVLGGVRAALQEDDIFFRGVNSFRSNQFINTTGIEGKYPVSRDLILEGGYTFGIRHFGRIQGGQDVLESNLFNTITHTWFGGPRYQLTRNDSIAAIYRQTFFTQTRSAGGGRTVSTNLISLEGDYTKQLQEWGFTVRGGLTFAEPVGRTFPSGSFEARTKVERDTVLALTLSRAGRPIGFLQGGAMISNLARVGISHRVYERLSVKGSVGYALNELFPNTDSSFSFLTASSGLSYKVTRTIIAQILYQFRNIDVDRPELQYQLSRHQVGLTLSIALDSLEIEAWD